MIGRRLASVGAWPRPLRESCVVGPVNSRNPIGVQRRVSVFFLPLLFPLLPPELLLSPRERERERVVGEPRGFFSRSTSINLDLSSSLLLASVSSSTRARARVYLPLAAGKNGERIIIHRGSLPDSGSLITFRAFPDSRSAYGSTDSRKIFDALNFLPSRRTNGRTDFHRSIRVCLVVDLDSDRFCFHTGGITPIDASKISETLTEGREAEMTITRNLRRKR